MWNILIQLALGVALSLLGQALKPKAKPRGITGSTAVGGDAPLSFILGLAGTEGHREYVGTWGHAGGTPNAYLTFVYSLADLPVRGLSGLFVFGERVTIDWNAAVTAQGYPVTSYRRHGTDYLWVKFYDGTQEAADPFLIQKFGGVAERPWRVDMIGRGVPYVILTARVNGKLFSGVPEYFFEVEGYEVEDPRGDDAQDNNVVLIRQVLRGLSFDGAWLWGPQDLPTTRMPAANWEAQMDKCDALVGLLAGGTEKRFRAGLEISVDMAPIDVIEDLLVGCNGRIAEVGGFYKILVGEPDAQVVSFTDEDVIITEGQSFSPFPGLEATYNGIAATYPEPAEKWAMKEAPPLNDALLEADDDGRHLPAEIGFGAVPYGTQVQRLMRAMQLEHRRFRTHAHTMPPAWWEYEVLDLVEWTSVRNGYEDKGFLITAMDDLPNANQFVALKEQDASDYDWVAETHEQVTSVAPLEVVRPPSQVIDGWTLTATNIADQDGLPRRPAVIFGWDADIDDVRAVGYQLRVKATGEVIYSDSTDDVSAGNITVASAAILPNQLLEGRGIYHPLSPREADWTAWIDVLTLGGEGDIPLGNIANLRATFRDNTSALDWDETSDFRSPRYEIRRGVDWATAQTLGDVAHPPFATQGNGTYHVAAVLRQADGAVLYSPDPAAIAIAGDTLVANVIASFDEQDTGWPGTITGPGEIADGFFKTTAAGTVSYYEVPSGHFVDALYVRPTRLAIEIKISGEPVSQNILDDANILEDPDILGADSSRLVDGWVEVAVAQEGSTDAFSVPDAFAPADIFSGGVEFAAWQKFAPGVYLGRYFKFQLALISYDETVRAVAQAFTHSTDVPDRIERITGYALDPGGETFTFVPEGMLTAAPFNGGPDGAADPNIVVTVLDAVAGDQVLITDVSVSACTIQILNGGLGVSRVINVIIQGW